MKKLLSLLAVVFTVSMTTLPMVAEAKRIGGGKSSGMQRQATPPAKAPNAAPAAAPAAGAAGAAAGASTRSKWMGPIAGLAAGLGIAALASHLGFGEELANMMMIGLLIMAVLAVIAFVMRKRAAAQGGGMAYAGPGSGMGSPNGGQQASGQPNALRTAMPAPQGGSLIGSALGGGQTATASSAAIPADFDTASFERNAKVNYIRLQAANDAGDMDDIRQFTTPEMFAEIQMDFRERGGATQQTEVENLEARVLAVAEEGAMYVVSVQFTGSVREDGEMADISEIWHLTKPRHVPGGWQIAGIQQS